MKKTLCAFVISFIIVNVLFALYSTDAGWIKREGGATAGVYIPGHFIINLEEGMGIRKVDANGYLNKSAELAEEYVLCFGKSHTNALEVRDDERYVSLLNNYISDNVEVSSVYSVARGGNTFADLISGFGALTQEFDNSSCVILEVDSVGELADIKAAIAKQRKWTEKDSVNYLIENQSFFDVCKTILKEKLPLLAYLINERVAAIDVGIEHAFVYSGSDAKLEVEDYLNEADEYGATLSEALELIRSQYENRIIVLYHPDISIARDGKMIINKMNYYDELRLACEIHGIELCDVSNEFRKAYEENYIVPYGFINTSMGTGHLNKYGHKMIADYLYNEYFMGVE